MAYRQLDTRVSKINPRESSTIAKAKALGQLSANMLGSEGLERKLTEAYRAADTDRDSFAPVGLALRADEVRDIICIIQAAREVDKIG